MTRAAISIRSNATQRGSQVFPIPSFITPRDIALTLVVDPHKAEVEEQRAPDDDVVEHGPVGGVEHDLPRDDHDQRREDGER